MNKKKKKNPNKYNLIEISTFLSGIRDEYIIRRVIVIIVCTGSFRYSFRNLGVQWVLTYVSVYSENIIGIEKLYLYKTNGRAGRSDAAAAYLSRALERNMLVYFSDYTSRPRPRFVSFNPTYNNNIIVRFPFCYGP